MSDSRSHRLTGDTQLLSPLYTLLEQLGSQPDTDELRSAENDISRDEILMVLRRHLGAGQSEIREAFEKRRISGVAAAHALAALTDEAIRGLVAFAEARAGTANTTPQDRLCLCATGGYGAGLLAPFSDIDVLFLTDENASAAATARIEFILYILWDLGLRVGHATRSLSACLNDVGTDITIRTALLDLRPLCGNLELAAQLRSRLSEDLQERTLASFIDGKIEERGRRHKRLGDSFSMVEPNLKEGRGGLRDLQTLNWLGRAALGCPLPLTGSTEAEETAFPPSHGPSFVSLGFLTDREAHRARRAWNFFWTVRLHLHYITGRAEERLTFDVQPIIGGRMGYATHGRQRGVERFMRHYFLTARDVLRLTYLLEPIVLTHLETRQPGATSLTEQGPEGFNMIAGKLFPGAHMDFAQNPRLMFQMLDCARRHECEVHPLALQQLIRHEKYAISLRDDPETARLFLELLRAPSNQPDKASPFWLPILNDTGLLGHLLPDWSRVVGQMQFDSYHIYTVDEHIIEAVRILGEIEAGSMADEIPLAYELTRDLWSRKALYVSVLLHDIAKGRGGDHSEIGAELALDICPRLGLDPEETDTVSWLVLHHLLLSHTAFTRDIDDPRTILDLADTIQSPERLKLLLLLTIADMRAVSPKVWNAWKATLLRELYSRVAEVLEGGMAASEQDVRVAHARQLARENLLPLLPEDSVNQFLDLGYPSYWLGFDTETHIRHARMVHDSDRYNAPITVEATPIPDRGVTEMTILCADHPGLFSQIAGTIAVAGASIVDARIHTLSDGMALDTFWVQDRNGCAFEDPHQLGRLNTLIEQALCGRLNIAQGLEETHRFGMSRRMRAIHVPPRVVIDNAASDRHTIIEINGRDRPGLLHDITATLSKEALQIASAHITTYGMRAVDVFYVKDLLGQKLHEPERIRHIRAVLLNSLKADPVTTTASTV
ncbi:[protein-PII] uridylyltransferase [Neokomagataea tanensis]|uniref:Bifunctional uridylyltransferase/uridylyl-removing enzyme n=1 Tax=Neokomagataea tanensis TaxID=661191 RepID=A0A4Y6V7B8_9PROT|nr:[protein-PII] uridylyltransferase [Neokomagataea tanensis]